MSVKYAAVKWTVARCTYDAVMIAGIIAYLAVFVLLGHSTLIWH